MARKKQIEKEDVASDEDFVKGLEEEEEAVEPLDEVFDGLSSLEDD
jgi:hypothetical protein